MKKRDRQFRIPYQFKFIGMVIIVLTLLVIVAVTLLPIEIPADQNALYKNGVVSFLLLGLLFNALADEKKEDERSYYLKTRALAGCFAGGIIYVIVVPFIKQFFNSPMEVSGQEVAFAMLSVYLIMDNLQRFFSEEV